MKTHLSKKSKWWKTSLSVIAIILLLPYQHQAIPTNAAGIEFDPGSNTFKVACQFEGADVACTDLDLSPYQFFWKFGNCGFSFDAQPSYTFKEGEPQDVSLSLKRINIYDEEYGPSKIGFSRSFSGQNTELPVIASNNGLLDLNIYSSGDIRGLFQSVIVIEYQNRTEFSLNNAEISIELSQVLDPFLTLQSCCSGINYNRVMVGGKDNIAITIDKIDVNQKCNIYLLYNVGDAFRSKVNETVNIKANSFINFNQDYIKRLNLNLKNPGATATRVPSDQEDISLKVTEPFDPNSKIGVPVGCIRDQELITYTISFLNEGTANTNIIDIEDTLSEHLDISSIQFESLNVLGIDMDINSPAVKFDINNNVLHWEFPAVLPPDPGSNASQGFLTFSVRTNDGIPEETSLMNRANIIFDKGQGMLTNTMVHKVNCKDSKKGPRPGKLLFTLLIIILVLLIIILIMQFLILKKT